MKATTLGCSLALASAVLAKPISSEFALQPGKRSSPLSVPLKRRSAGALRDEASFLRKARHMRNKYNVKAPSATGSAEKAKRSDSTGTVTLTNYGDAEYYGTITIGTPAVSYDVVMDTGSADLIMATSGCSGCSSDTTGYSASSSSTAATSTTAFSITYGSGSASGVLDQDTVSIGGYNITKQTFAACSTMNNILSGSIDGLLGLGWQPLASSGATPLVQALAQAGDLPEEVFGFAFKTYSTLTSETNPGGTMTVGGTDTSLYSGSINWVNIATPASYWAIDLDGVTVGGNSTGLTESDVVIDSGTSLIGVPQSAAESIYAQIPNSAAVTVEGESGYYSYPCEQTVDVSFTFGGVSYAIPSANFNSGTFSSDTSQCLGAVFVLTSSSSSSFSWIIGDSFLNGVYSAFRFSDPPAVGFATLGSGGESTASTTTSSAVSSAAITSAISRSTFLGSIALATAVMANLLW